MVDNLLPLVGPENSGIGFSAVLIVILFVILTVTAIHYYYKTQESYQLGSRIPGPDPIPILGNALMALGKTPNGKLNSVLCCSN